MKLTPYQRVQMVIAVAVAASYKLLVAAKTIWEAIRAKDEQTVADDIYLRRLAVCHSCPVFYAPLSTCGTPLRRSNRHVGCHCYMVAAAKLKEHRCWLRESTDLPEGWPDDLNSEAENKIHQTSVQSTFFTYGVWDSVLERMIYDEIEKWSNLSI